MINLGSYPGIQGTFPSVVTKDNTTPTSNDGTPLRKLLFDDIFGLFQAIASQGNITPSGSNDVYNDSDLLNGIKNISGGAGELVLFCGPYVKLYTTDKRIIPCMGQSVSASLYQELTDNAWCGISRNPTAESFYRTSDSEGLIRSVSGDYLWLPNCQGMFLRGFDTGTGVDPQGGSRSIWEQQNDKIKEHVHRIRVSGLGSSWYSAISISQSGSGELYNLHMSYTAPTSSEAKAEDFNGSSEHETRPVNLNPIICVRY